MPKVPEDKRLAWLREITTASLGTAIVAVTLYLLYGTFRAAPGFEQRKDVMLCGLTLLGTVIGYYFGRVPVERRAEASEENARKAQHTANKATVTAAEASRQQKEAAEKLAEAKVGVQRVKSLLAPGGGPQAKTLGAESAVPGRDRSSEALFELEVLSRRL